MAKKSSSSKSAKPTPVDLEKQIEKVDRDLIKLANERAHLTERLLKSRQQAGEPVYRPEDEARIVKSLVETSKGPLSPATIQGIALELVSGSRSLIQPLRVAYLGPAYSYSHAAAINYFGPQTEFVPVSTIATVFDEVNRRQVSYGVVPLENSTDGRIADTLEMFCRLPVHICGEVRLRIHHYLLAKCTRAEITEVYSKPQAISQCRDWLARHLPGIRIVEMASTTAAAKVAAEKPGAAAIAGRQAGIQYGLNFVDQDIEDNKHNVTRFAIIGQASPKRTGHDKTAIMFELAHRPGSLAEAMSAFKYNKLNLTWIESFPTPGTKNEYHFFIEFEGHESDAKVQKALTNLKKKTSRTEILGSYPTGEICE